MAAVVEQETTGDFSVRLPSEWTGLAGKVADAFKQGLAAELPRLTVLVGQQGRIREHVSLGRVSGAWANSVAHVNSLLANLVQPTSEANRVIGAVSPATCRRIRPRPTRGPRIY